MTKRKKSELDLEIRKLTRAVIKGSFTGTSCLKKSGNDCNTSFPEESKCGPHKEFDCPSSGSQYTCSDILTEYGPDVCSDPAVAPYGY